MSIVPGRVARRLLMAPLALVFAAGAQPPAAPQAPPFYAIRNARLVTVSGLPLENATLVLTKGLIAAIGKDAPIPPEAWVIEGEGLTVYPGLTDALTNLGLSGAAESPGQPTTGESPFQQVQQARTTPAARGPEDRPGTTPWENAADLLKTSDKRMESWRKAGFTSAVSAPDKGFFTGQAAFIHLGIGDPGELVVKTPVALRMNLTPMGGLFGFPGSLMGVFAYSRQTYLDAQHYRQAWKAYEAGPRGRERPGYERALEPIGLALANRWPILLPANLWREMDRAVAFSEEMGLAAILYGAHQAYERAGALAAKRVPVLVSLKWPERDKDADPDAEEALSVLRLRDRAPSTPAALERAGVRFAFYSDGLANPQDVLKNVRKAVAAGLSPEAALRAFTLAPAEIFGLADRLGSLEVGKIADLVVADGDLFAEKTKVKMVFVDGRKYEIREVGGGER